MSPFGLGLEAEPGFVATATRTHEATGLALSLYRLERGLWDGQLPPPSGFLRALTRPLSRHGQQSQGLQERGQRPGVAAGGGWVSWLLTLTALSGCWGEIFKNMFRISFFLF